MGRPADLRTNRSRDAEAHAGARAGRARHPRAKGRRSDLVAWTIEQHRPQPRSTSARYSPSSTGQTTTRAPASGVRIKRKPGDVDDQGRIGWTLVEGAAPALVDPAHGGGRTKRSTGARRTWPAATRRQGPGGRAGAWSCRLRPLRIEAANPPIRGWAVPVLPDPATRQEPLSRHENQGQHSR